VTDVERFWAQIAIAALCRLLVLTASPAHDYSLPRRVADVIGEFRPHAGQTVMFAPWTPPA